MKALPSFDGRSQFSTWVYRIATNAALDELRRVGRRPIPSDNETVIDSSQNDRTEAVGAQLDVVAALAEIAEEYRTTLVLRHVADLEYEEIATIQGIAIGTVRSRLARGRAQLVEILGNQDPDSQRHTDSNSANERGHHEQ